MHNISYFVKYSITIWYLLSRRENFKFIFRTDLFLKILSILMSTFQICILKCLGALYFVMKLPDICLGLTHLFSSDSVEFNIVSELNILIDIVHLLHFLHWFLPTLIWPHMIMRPGYTSWSYDDCPWLHSMVWPHMTMRPGYTSWSYDDCPWLHSMVWPHMTMRPGCTYVLSIKLVNSSIQNFITV